MRARAKREAGDITGLSEELVASLEDLYPPRCMEVAENATAHHRYAGKVELVKLMRDLLDNNHQQHLEEILGHLEGDD